VQESDFQDDFCQNHVIVNLQALGEDLNNGGMFILSQLNFGNYLDQPAYAATVKQLRQNGLRLPADLDTVITKYSDGEADIIIFHRFYGILVGELKSIGRAHGKPADSALEKRIEKAINQLDNAAIVISYVISDVAPGLTNKDAVSTLHW
jgi:hypothetical protein